MSKRIALLSAAAFAALALTATVAAPVSAQEKTVMVGGAADCFAEPVIGRVFARPVGSHCKEAANPGYAASG